MFLSLQKVSTLVSKVRCTSQQLLEHTVSTDFTIYTKYQNKNQKSFNVLQTGKFVCHSSDRILQKQKHVTRTGTTVKKAYEVGQDACPGPHAGCEPTALKLSTCDQITLGGTESEQARRGASLCFVSTPPHHCSANTECHILCGTSPA